MIWVCETKPKEHGEHKTNQLAIKEYEGFHVSQSKTPPSVLKRYVCPICKSPVKIKKD